MQFDLLRLSLIARSDLFVSRKADGQMASREEWLRETFTQEIVFPHRGDTFHYVPEPAADETGLPIIIGRIGRRVKVQENHPPESGLTETKREAWKAALILIDPRHHADGQKVAFEHKSPIGTPISVFSSLSSMINHWHDRSPYVIEVGSISDAESFWQFVSEHRGDVTHVTFEFFAPNMFGVHDDYEKEMKELRDNEKIKKVKLQLEGLDGLKLETERVKSAVNYTSRGGGNITAKTKNGRKYRSKQKTKRITIDEGRREKFSLVSFLENISLNIFKL